MNGKPVRAVKTARESMFQTVRASRSALVLSALISARASYAQPLPDEQLTASSGAQAKYKRAIDAAVEEYELGNFAESREQFRRAHELAPSARTLRGLGITEFQLRNYVDAVAFLEQALASEAKPLTGALRDQTMQTLENARGYVGQLRLYYEPATASVIIDGVPVAVPSGSAVRITVGDHVFEFRADGHLSERRLTKLFGGQNQELRVNMTAPPDVSDSRPVAMPPHDPVGLNGRTDRSLPNYKRWWIWAAATVVVAGIAAGTTVALSSRTQHRTEPLRTPNSPEGVSLQPLSRY